MPGQILPAARRDATSNLEAAIAAIVDAMLR
jgi:hypothetical protein